MPQRSDRREGAGLDAIVVTGVFVVLGLLGGVLWSQVVTPASFTRLASGGSMGEDELAKQFGADGWFVVIGAVTGLVAGFVLCWWRSRDVLVTCLLVVGGALAAGVLMAVVGHLLGPGSTRSALAAAKVGQKVPEQLGLGTRPVSPIGPYLRDAVTFYPRLALGRAARCLLRAARPGPRADGLDRTAGGLSRRGHDAALGRIAGPRHRLPGLSSWTDDDRSSTGYFVSAPTERCLWPARRRRYAQADNCVS